MCHQSIELANLREYLLGGRGEPLRRRCDLLSYLVELPHHFVNLIDSPPMLRPRSERLGCLLEPRHEFLDQASRTTGARFHVLA